MVESAFRDRLALGVFASAEGMCNPLGVSDDDGAILSRRQLLIASALVGLGSAASSAVAQPLPCLSPPPPVLPRFSREPGRITTPRNRIPEAIRRHLTPDVIIFAAGGGLTSTPWRIVVPQVGYITVRASDEVGAASHGELPLHRRHGVYSGEGLVRLADHVWREPRRPTAHPTTSYGEVLALNDRGAAYFFLDGFGPIRGGAAEQLVANLRQLMSG